MDLTTHVVDYTRICIPVRSHTTLIKVKNLHSLLRNLQKG